MSPDRPAAIVFCERLDNESFCESVIRELGARYEVRACGPGWPNAKLSDVDPRGVRFYLELDAASGSFVRPEGLAELAVPKFAWLIDTHKKPLFHRQLARDMDLTFHAMRSWAHVIEGPRAWLPLHADPTIFRPVERERDIDLAFVGSQRWRADAIVEIARRHGLRVHVSTTTGPREKSETAAIYARSKLVFNLHCTNDLNFRVFETLACGRVLLTDAQWNGQYELFEDGRHLVYYKDVRDLEQRILELLRDPDRRAWIEREAAAHAHQRHTTPHRVRELVATIEHVIAPRIEVRAERRRWLFFAGAEPGTVEGLSYGERLARDLARRGHEVVVVREARRALPVGTPGDGEPEVHEVAIGPVPRPLGDTNTKLAAASPLHARFDAIARSSEVDVIVGEGPLGALVAAPVAERLAKPFVLALEACEVDLRGNVLNRDQLYWAELENWGSDRASAVVVPDEATRAAVEHHYHAANVRVIAPSSPDPPVPRDADALLHAVGLEGPFTLVLAGALSPSEKRAQLERAAPAVVLATKDEVWSRVGADVRLLSTRPATAGPLAALLARADTFVALDPRDARLAEARRLGRRAEGGPAPGDVHLLETLAGSLAPREAVSVS